MATVDFKMLDQLTGQIIERSIAVHRALGPGLLESTYHACLNYELRRAGLKFFSNVHLPLRYGDIEIDCAYEIDLMVEHTVIVELKAVRALAPVHHAQLLTYLKLTGYPAGLLLNFNVPVLKQGVRRMLNTPAR